jgi:hypothetical protein
VTRSSLLATHVAPLALLASLTAACGGGDKGLAQTPATASTVPGPVQGNLLLFPQAEGESLLGRAVSQSPGGGFTIADARAPGCEVVVHHTVARYKTHRDVKTSLLASIGVGYQQLISLEAKYGRDSQASLDLDNSEILDADLRGNCGDKVISRVFVGKGKRRVYAASNASGGANILVTPALKLGPKGERTAEDTDEISWDTEEGYAFELKESAKGESFELTVRVPSILTEGEPLDVAIETTKDAYLIVLYVDSDGKTDVLWPSNEEPRPETKPAAPAHIPSAAEKQAGIAIKPATKDGKPTKESMVVYAFTDKRDFDLVKPSAGNAGADGAAYGAELTKKLRDIPASRWSRAQVAYTVQPKGKK